MVLAIAADVLLLRAVAFADGVAVVV